MDSKRSSQHRPRRPVPAPSNRVLLETQKQWYFTDEELTRTPSLLDGMSMEAEHIQRSKGVNFIVQVGMMLKLPQLTLTTAAVFLHRFFVRYSMVDLPRRPGLHPYSVAAGCLFLASKVDENCRKIRELVIACCRVAQKNPNLEVDEQNKEFWKWKDTLLAYEDLCLEALCFDLQLEQPHKICYEFLCYFGKNDHKPLRNAAWAFLNDSNFTVLCLQFYPRTIAAAALWAGARLCDVAFEDDEEGRPWWEQLDVNLTEVRRAVSRMVQLYEKNTVHRQSHQYPTISTDSDGTSETTRIVNPHPSNVPVSKSEGGGGGEGGEMNGRKRSREVENTGSPLHAPATTKNDSSFESNSREPSPKRQRLTPDPSRTPAESFQSSSSTTTTQNGRHQTTPRSNSRIPSAAFHHDQNRRQQHPLPPPPPPVPAAADSRDRSNGVNSHYNTKTTDSVDAVQQRIDEIVQQGMARNGKGSNNRNDSNNNNHRSERERDRDRDWDRDKYRDHDRYRDRDHDWDSRRDRDGSGGGRRRADSYEGGGGGGGGGGAGYRDRDRGRGRDYRESERDRDRPQSDQRPSIAATNTSSTSSDSRRRLSTEPAATAIASLPPRPAPPPSHSRSFNRSHPGTKEGDTGGSRQDDEGEEGEINSDKEEGEVTSTNPPSAHNDEDGGGSEEGEL